MAGLSRTIKVTDKTEINVKRFYIPVQFEVECPTCDNGTKVAINLNDSYLMYPEVNGWSTVGGECDICDEYCNVSVKLRIELDVDDAHVEKG